MFRWIVIFASLAVFFMTGVAHAEWISNCGCPTTGIGTTQNSILDECPSGVGGYVRAPTGAKFCSTCSNAEHYCFYGPAGSTTGAAIDAGVLGCLDGGVGNNTCDRRTTSEQDCIDRVPNCKAAAVTIPAAPTGVSAAGGTSVVTVSWSTLSGVTYKVLRGTVSGTYGTTVISGTTEGTVDDTVNIANGTKYFYVVRATNSAGTSGNSSVVNATPMSAPILAVPTTASGQVNLAWTAPTGIAANGGATGYSIRRRTTGSFVQIATVSSGSTLTYPNIGLADGTTYHYVIRATNTGGISNASNERSATTPVAFSIALSSSKTQCSSNITPSSPDDRLMSGTAKVTVSGGSSPYTISWSPAPFRVNTSPVASVAVYRSTSALPTVVTATVTDSAGVVRTATAVFGVCPPLNACYIP